MNPKEKRDRAWAAMNAIVDRARAEHRDLTPGELTEWERHYAELEAANKEGHEGRNYDPRIQGAQVPEL